jgi:hypothetical protein
MPKAGAIFSPDKKLSLKGDKRLDLILDSIFYNFNWETGPQPYPGPPIPFVWWGNWCKN